MRIQPVSSGMFPYVEDRLAPYFDGFAERSSGRWTADDYRGWVRDGTAQCWVVVDGEADIKACLLTQIRTDRAKTVEVIACVGEDRADWQHLMGEFAASCRDRGHKLLRLVARPGWARVMKPLGFRETHRVLDMEL